jgi:hypothetical protein
MPGKTGDGSLRTTSRTRLKRLPKRGRFDRATIHAILDATPLCHVGYLIDGRPLVTPTLHWREGERVYWHGSRASRALLASEDADYALPIWAGVVPVGMAVGRPAADPRNLTGVAEPRYLRRLKLG